MGSEPTKSGLERRGKVLLNISEVNADSIFSITSFCHMFTSIKVCISKSGHPSPLTGWNTLLWFGARVHNSFWMFLWALWAPYSRTVGSHSDRVLYCHLILQENNSVLQQITYTTFNVVTTTVVLYCITNQTQSRQFCLGNYNRNLYYQSALY